jgi:hypothetical protein
MSSLLALETTWRQGDRLRALVEPVPPAEVVASRTGDSPIVELTSVIGRVVVDSPQSLRADQDNRPVRW